MFKFTCTSSHPSLAPPLRFSHSETNPPRGSQYPGHLPSQSHYTLDLWGPDCKLPRSTGPLSFNTQGLLSRASLYTARRGGTTGQPGTGLSPSGPGAFYQNHLPAVVDRISNISFPSFWKERKKSFRQFPVDLHAITEASLLRVCECWCVLFLSFSCVCDWASLLNTTCLYTWRWRIQIKGMSLIEDTGWGLAFTG